MTASETVRLSELCDLIAEPVRPGGRPDALYLGLEHLASGHLVRIGGGKAADMRSNTSAFKPGDVLYGKLRPYLDKAVLAKEAGVCTTELLVLRPNAGVDARFLAAVVHSPGFLEYAVAGTTGVQHPRTSWAHIRKFGVTAFTLDEQRRIADLLWLVHEAISRSETLVEEGQALKRAAMRTMFTRGLRGEVQKDTEIGPMPENWKVVSFRSVREKLQYGTSVRCTYDVSERPVLRIPNIEPQCVNADDLKYCALSSSDAARYQLEDGDLLFIRTNGVLDRLGSCAVYEGHPANALFASYLIRARVRPDHVVPHFAASFFGSEHGTSIVAGRAISASDGKFNLNTAAIDSLLLPLPPTLSEQREIITILDAIDHKIELHRRKRTTLEELFKALLHRLMTGEIRAGDITLNRIDYL
ncbi:MAG: restriction endonuclease subunit S [Gemmatimonadota bacterium]|nr:restriction endonuclease subunit S [Gemmatimonadota bacterium]